MRDNKAMDIAEENRRVRLLKRVVDLHLQIIALQRGLKRGEALEILEGVRALAGRLFPGKTPTFDLIYTPRFERIIRERFGTDRES